jgi:copper(I)-binding protein
VSPRRSLGALLLLALVATGCGAGRDTDTDKERATPYVADATAGPVAVRAIRIVLAGDVTAQAYLTATFVNRGEKTDTLVNATVAGGAVQPAGFDVTGLPLPPSQVVRLVDPEAETTGPSLIVGALSTELLTGTTQKVTMTFQSAGTVTVDVPVMTVSDIGTTAPTASVTSPGS